MLSQTSARSPRVVAIRIASLIVAAAATAFGAVLADGRSFVDLTVPEVVYAAIALCSGLVLVAAALVGRGRSRFAWSLIGSGVLCWGIGEAVWMIQTQAGEIPYPGIADFFYVAGYPLIFAGVIALPYLRPGRYERLRLTLDATAGTISLGVVMWVAYLDDIVSLGSDPVETFLNLLYPFGDVLLVTALMVLAMRRSEQRIDLRVILLAGGVAFTAVADVIFSLQSATDSYVEWGRAGLAVALQLWASRPRRICGHQAGPLPGEELSLAQHLAVGGPLHRRRSPLSGSLPLQQQWQRLAPQPRHHRRSCSRRVAAEPGDQGEARVAGEAA